MYYLAVYGLVSVKRFALRDLSLRLYLPAARSQFMPPSMDPSPPAAKPSKTTTPLVNTSVPRPNGTRWSTRACPTKK